MEPSLDDVLEKAAELQELVPSAVLVGLDEAAAVLADIDARPEAVSVQLVKQLADSRPRDGEVTTQLAEYKALDPCWHDWSAVKVVLEDLAQRIVR